jgi:hypothetical protein
MFLDLSFRHILPFSLRSVVPRWSGIILGQWPDCFIILIISISSIKRMLKSKEGGVDVHHYNIHNPRHASIYVQPDLFGHHGIDNLGHYSVWGQFRIHPSLSVSC